MTKKVVLITGASSGFGKDTALELLKKGYVVYGAARRVEKMEDIKKAGGHVLKMDVTSDQSVTEGVSEIIAKHGRIDILYANAGYGIYGSVFDTEVDMVKAMYDVNVHGTHRTVRAVTPYMIKQNSGRIIITESIVSNVSSGYMGWYASTKHALKAMTNALAAELKDFNIDLVSIRPGAVKTEFDDVALAEENLATPTKEIANDQTGFVLFMTDTYKTCPGPESTVKCMVKAAESKKPKRIYNTTSDAVMLPIIQSILGAKAVGKMLANVCQSRYKKFVKTGK